MTDNGPSRRQPPPAGWQGDGRPPAPAPSYGPPSYGPPPYGPPLYGPPTSGQRPSGQQPYPQPPYGQQSYPQQPAGPPVYRPSASGHQSNPQQWPAQSIGSGPGPGPGLGPRSRRSMVPWIAVAGVVVIAAAAALVIILTNSAGQRADPTNPPATLTDGTIRAYPSLTFTTSPADAQAQKQAQQTAQSWVTAVNKPDIEAAVEFMCERNQRITESQLLQGVEPGSFKAGQVAINGKKGVLPLTVTTSKGQTTSASLPLVQEDGWKVCLT